MAQGWIGAHGSMLSPCRTVDLNAVEHVGNTDSRTSGGETTASALGLELPADEQYDSRGMYSRKGS